MASSFDSLLNDWFYDIEQILKTELAVLSDRLELEEEHTREDTEKEICDILNWLYPPSGPLSAEEQLRRTREAINDESLSPQERIAAARRVARSTGRQRGRPRTDTPQHAIRALSLHLATPRSWREIALIVKGCNHRRPNPEQRSCGHCGDAIRDAVGRLEKFLHSKGYHPGFPRRVELDRMSHADLERLFGPPIDSEQ